MNITKSEIVKIVTAIKIQCPEALPYKDETELDILVDMWFDIFKGITKEIVWTATRNALKNTVYQKQNWVGAISQEIEKLRTAYEKTDGELWTELTSVLNGVGKLMYFGTARHWYNGKLIEPMEEVNKIYQKLDPILQNYVGGVSGLIALSKQETLEYEKGRFLKNVEILRTRERAKKETPLALAGIVQELSGRFVIESKETKLLKGETK